MDMTTVRVLWMRYEIAAIIDGFSRKIVGFQAYVGTPSTADLLKFIDQFVRTQTHDSSSRIVEGSSKRLSS